MASIGLKAQADNHPLNWKTPVYTQFAMIGVSILIFVFLPESPCEWCLTVPGPSNGRVAREQEQDRVTGGASESVHDLVCRA